MVAFCLFGFLFLSFSVWTPLDGVIVICRANLNPLTIGSLFLAFFMGSGLKNLVDNFPASGQFSRGCSTLEVTRCRCHTHLDSSEAGIFLSINIF